MYSLDEAAVFDPSDLDETVTPQAVHVSSDGVEGGGVGWGGVCDIRFYTITAKLVKNIVVPGVSLSLS